MLGEAFAGREPDITEENVQAIRGRRDGALEQVRLARAHHGQQVRAVGGLRDPVRRHGRRLRGPQGRLQGLGLPPRTLAQRAAGRELVPATVLDRPPSAELRYEQRDDDSLPPYDLLDRSSRDTSRRTWMPWSCAARPAADDVERVIAWWTAPSTSGARPRRGSRSLDQGVGRDRRLPITNSYVGRVRRGSRRRADPRPEHESTLYGNQKLCGRSIPSPAAGPPLRREQHAERSWPVCREPASALRPHRHRHPRDRAQPTVSSSKVTSRAKWLGLDGSATPPRGQCPPWRGA